MRVLLAATLGLLPLACDDDDADEGKVAAEAESEPKAGAEAKSGGETPAQPEEADPIVLEDDADASASDGPVSEPKVAWQTDFTSAARALSIADDGTLAATFEGEIKGYLDGRQVWSKEGAYADLQRLQDGSLATSIGAVVSAFDPSTGQVEFEVEIPEPATAPKKKGKPQPPPPVVAVAPFGSQLAVAMADARFFVIDPPTCVSKGAGCLRPAGLLVDEYLEPTARLSVTDDGTRLLVEGKAMRAFDLALDELFSIEASEPIDGTAAIPGGHLAITLAGELVRLDVAACKGGTVRLGRTPVAPRGCVRWRYGRALEPVAPAVVDAQTLAVNGNERLQAVINGTDSWKTPIGAIGRVIADGPQLVYTMSALPSDAGPTISVKAVDARLGTVSWTLPLPFSLGEGETTTADQLQFDKRGDYVAAAVGVHTAVLVVPPAPPAAAPASAAGSDVGAEDDTAN